RFHPILPFFVYPLDNLHFFLTCHKCQAVEKRIAAKDRLALVAEAQEKGVYAYAKHFGDTKRV
ncbi:hypothetical protein Q5692_39215, partial [Microcoleus sp. C2C3]|uniref:hypothetical protein n=1 Tax=unclassified Microcoleus TaxID=2642155 RepID=UPI002FD0751B